MNWGLKEEWECAGRKGKGLPKPEESRGKGLEEGDQGVGATFVHLTHTSNAGQCQGLQDESDLPLRGS